MELITLSKIRYIIIFFFFIFIKATESIIGNPQYLFTIYCENPIFYNSNEMLYILYSGHKYSQNIDTKNKTDLGNFCNYNSPYILIKDEENNPLYLYSKGSPNLISLSDSEYNCNSRNLNPLKFPLSSSFVDYIKEDIFFPMSYYQIEPDDVFTGLRCLTLENEIIIYGKNETNKISFTLIEKKISVEIDTSCQIDDIIKCTRLMSSAYLCAFICGSRVYIGLYAYQTKTPNNSNDCKMNEAFKKEISTFGSHSQVRMIDLSAENENIVCAKNNENNKIECLKIEYTYNEYDSIEEEVYDEETNKTTYYKNNQLNFTLSYDNQITFSLYLSDNNNDDCVFKKSFENEYLFCCGGVNLITCGRMDEESNYINSFNISASGNITNLDFIVYSSSINLIYHSNISYYHKLYEYSIILPSCVDKTFSIIPLGSFSEYLSTLIKKEINSSYYIRFIGYPYNYGNLKLESTLIDINDTRIILVSDYNKFGFISLNDETAKNLEINYLIIIKETFSSSCTVNLNILECYESCHTCTKSGEESTSENHNCNPNSCKEFYYSDPDKNTNCWNSYEGKPNWYIDYENGRFKYCHELCAKCNGPTDSNCLECKSDSENKYLANNQCLTSCPDGFYPKKAANNFYNCLPCIETCETCTGEGTIYNMKCSSCKENSIRYQNNCFKEANSNDKSFYLPGTTTLSSCFQQYDFFIIANTYECITNRPSEGYFLENRVTGLYSRCHPDCKSCEEKYTETNTKCILCLNEDLNLHEGNCIENCPIGFFSLEKSETNNQKRCASCYFKCYSCEKGQEYTPNYKISKMNCLQCQKVTDPNDANNKIDRYIFLDKNCFPFVTYSQEKITFDISDIIVNSDENNIKTCFDYGLSIFYGQYECIEKPSNTYYVLNNEENTGVIEYCHEACATCLGAQNSETQDTNCIICSDGYFKTEDSETNCILESSIPANYYKNSEDNIYYKCFPNCQTCKRILDHKADINNMGCESCISNYYFVLQTDNCFSNSFLDENINYFFSTNDYKFHKCYYSCYKCSADGTNENNQNCDECIDDYYFEENTKNCFNYSYIEKGYYFDNFTINVEFDELPKFKKCYEKCKTCTNYLIGEDMNCITCITDYYKIVDTNNCITDITVQGYYAKGEIAYPCEENCLTCSDGQKPLDENDENNIDNNNNTITNITNNCLSCDPSRNVFLVENLNICEEINFKENGFYLKEESDGTKIFHKCYESCSLCEKYKEIDPISNKDNHNCDECAINYYRLLNDENPKNCYGEEEMVAKGYRLVRNFWQICHENCGSCSEKPTFDETNTFIISQNCLTCYTGFKFIYQTSDCADETYLEKGYYFDNIDQYYKPCDISCISCEKYSTEGDPKCIKCNEEKGYFNAEEKPISSCFNRSTIDEKYVLSYRYDENGNMYRKWAFCYETCFLCLYFGNEEDHGCSSCKSKHYLVYNTTNCITNQYAINNGYYFNSTYGKFFKCDNACNNCERGPTDGNTNCKDCNYEENYYPIEGKSNSMCYNNETIGEGYFLNQFSENYKWSSCYIYCATCEYQGSQIKMNCLSCRTNLKNKFDKIMQFLFINGNCIQNCPENLFLTKDGDCVSDCPNGTYHYQFGYNFSCVEFCPEKYVISSDGKKCELPEFQSYVSSSEFESIISTDITSYVNSSRIIDLDNLKAQIFYSNDYSNLQSDNKISKIINLDRSIRILKAKNDIPYEESLIIAIIETKENKGKNENLNRNKDLIDLGKSIKLIIYDSSGRKLDLSKCENEKIIITKKLDDLPYIDFFKSKDLFTKGIDAFNEEDSFFNDICYPFKTNSSCDIIIADRRNSLFQNISFCDYDCSYNGIDYESMTVNCICNIDSFDKDNNEENLGITLNNNKNKFPKELYDTNIILAKCTNLAFDKEILKKNVGFYLSLISFSFEMVFLVVYAKNGLTSIKNFMLIFNPISAVAHPPKLQNLLSIGQTNTNNNNENKKEEEIQKTILINHLLNNRSKIKKQKKQKNEADDALVVKYSQNDNEDYDSNRYSLNKEYNKKIKKEDQKRSISDSDSGTEKEKKTKITKRNNFEKKKTDKRNNLVLSSHNINNEKPKYIEGKSKNQIHPMDMYDTLSVNKNNEKNKNGYSKTKYEEDNLSSDSNFGEHKKNIDGNENKKNKKYTNKKEEKEKKKSKINEKKEDIYEQKIIIPYRNKNTKTITIINKEKNKKIFISTNAEYSIMEYDEAIKNDKRKWSIIYYGYLIDKNFIFNTFISESFIDLRSIKINFFCFRLEIIFILNALFYTDSYISKIYYNNGNLDFFTSLPKALYSFLVSILSTLILKIFANNQNDALRAIKEKDEKIEYEDVMKMILKKIKIKTIIFFVFQFLFSFIVLYYVTAFCAVYQNSNVYWLYGCLETLTIDFFFPFIFCIFLATFRYFGLVKRIKCFYDFANLLGLLL